MDALSDPRAFLSAQEKREQQMKAMGIEASDIDTKALKGGKGGAKPAGGAGKPAAGAAGAKKEEEARKLIFLILAQNEKHKCCDTSLKISNKLLIHRYRHSLVVVLDTVLSS